MILECQRYQECQKLSGIQQEDLFFYPINDLTLKMGERGYFQIFKEQVPYHHIYKWSIPDTVNENSNQNRNQTDISQEEIWHSYNQTH